MKNKEYYKKGDWNAVCDVCGFRFKASQLRRRWDGLMTCKDDWEIRQPQDLLRSKQDHQAVPWTRPEPTDTYIQYSRTASYALNPDGSTMFNPDGSKAVNPVSSDIGADL